MEGGSRGREMEASPVCVCVYEREINFCLSSHHYLGTFLSLIHMFSQETGLQG